jgi:RNA polymerase sigma-70 factor (ECF subfamily)
MPNEAAQFNSTRVFDVDQEELSPERLVEQCKAGSRAAFASLVEHYEKRVFNFLCQMAGNTHDAEDLTQETFLKVYQNIHRFNCAQAFSTWLFTIAKRTAFNHFRGARRFEELSGEEEADLNDPSVLLQQKDEKTSLWRLARVLKPDQYEALWLRYAEGFSIAETAKILNTNQIRVRVLLHRGRKALAQRLRGVDIQVT